MPDLADSEAGRRRALARWLHTLNPGPDYWNPLRPDPLADQLLADLDVLPELALTVTEQAIQHTDHATMDRMLAELTRAAAASGAAAATALSRILHDRLGDLLDAALTDPEGPLPQRLTAALDQVPAPAAAAELVDRLPEHSLALADLAETLTGQSVIHYRRLTADDPARHRPDLAGSLNNQSIRLADAGPARGRAGRHHRGRRDLPGAGRGPPGRVPPRPRRVAEQPVQPVGGAGPARGRAGRHHRGRRRSTGSWPRPARTRSAPTSPGR